MSKNSFLKEAMYENHPQYQEMKHFIKEKMI